MNRYVQGVISVAVLFWLISTCEIGKDLKTMLCIIVLFIYADVLLLNNKEE